MIDKIHRFIYISSIAIMGLFLFAVILGGLFFNYYRNFPSIEKIAWILVLITPFAPIGTLFGTLKENQSTGRKITIIVGTGLCVLFLLIIIWGGAFAAALD